VKVGVGWLSAEVHIMNMNDDWQVSLSVAETDGQTRAEARLVLPGGDPLAGRGVARRNPADREVARIGAEIAAARALSDLAGQLLQAAATAIEDSTHEPAYLHM
jgi:hypothetical protein